MSTKTAAVTRETFALTLDSTVPLAEQIRKGNYGYVNEFFAPANFTLTVTGTREVVLFDPNGFVSSEEMIRRMKQDGFVPATIDDALAMGIQFPDRQKKNPIVFLGTVWAGPDRDRRVPVLGDDWYDRRELRLDWFDIDWFVYDRFAAVRES